MPFEVEIATVVGRSGIQGLGIRVQSLGFPQLLGFRV